MISNYEKYCRPKTAKLLATLCLDKEYLSAEGNYMYYKNNKGEEIKVLDFLGGFGSCILGHNNPEIVSIIQDDLKNKTVFHGQMSSRKTAGELGEMLNGILNKRTHKNYVTTLANSGAEAVEAAVKHAELDQFIRIQNIIQNIDENNINITKRLKGEIELSEGYKKALVRLGIGEEKNINKQLYSISEFAKKELFKEPSLISVSQSYHGKTLGALQLTHNPVYKIPFNRLKKNVFFINPDDPADFDKISEKTKQIYYQPILYNNLLDVKIVDRLNVVAFFVEPIQGEGGINVLSNTFLKKCSDWTSKHDIPLVIDEIQSGMGRTGKFLASEDSGITGDYYLLSKSLGGGITKISATMIDNQLYREDFGTLHTSTFAEDNYSSNVAMKTLQILERDKRVYGNCVEKGNFLVNGLLKIKKKYPKIIQDVRGKGLMLGIEFCKFDTSGSPTLQTISKQNLLGYVATGYLLNEHNIRVAPSLSNNNVIRIEPSALIDQEQCETLLIAFERLCEIIYKQNLYALLSYLIEEELSRVEYVENYRVPDRPTSPDASIVKVGFIGHLTKANHASLYEKSFELFSESQIKKLLYKLYKVIDPQITHSTIIRSSTGKKIEFNFITFFITAEIIAKHIKAKDLVLLREKMEKATNVAVEYGCKVLGFGAFTSIITRNCKSIVTDEISITTGNTYTAAIGIEALMSNVKDGNIPIASSSIGLIGAAGNICSIYSKKMANYFPKMILVGRTDSDKRIIHLTKQIYSYAFNAILDQLNIIENNDERQCGLSGIAKELFYTRTGRELLKVYEEIEDIGAWIYDNLSKYPEDVAPIIITSELSYLKSCSVIISASNSAKPIIFPEMLSEDSVVICDIAVPPDVDRSVVNMCNNVTVLNGGIAKLPKGNETFQIAGSLLKSGEIYGCAAETIILGFTDSKKDFTGDIDMADLETMSHLGKDHGFSLAASEKEIIFQEY